MATRADHTEEDTVEYRLFPAIPEELGQATVHHYLEGIQDSYIAHLGKYLVEYIWQNEPFQLRIVPETESVPAHLYGSTNFGDNIEDEWFIVFLMYELTREFEELVVQIHDNDGEMLLIEAADNLPKWLNPETAENRVFISAGKVHIIPHPKTPTEVAMFPSGLPSLMEAVSCIREHWTSTTAFVKIQNNIEQRIQGYPEKIREFIHRTHCYLPASLAAVLDHTPSLVAPMVQSFYHRDPLSLKACITFQRFRPGTRVMREVKLSKCLYAQLTQQKFTPDKRSGYTVPPATSSKFRAYDLGAKLAHGAEMLCTNCGDMSDSKSTDIDRVSKKDARWHRFVNSLAEKGYFKDELEGSRLFQRLTDEAKKYFYSMVSSKITKPSSMGEQVLRTLSGLDYDLEEMRRQEKNLRPPDDDSWLYLSPDELDETMARIVNRTTAANGNFNPDQMTTNMKAFIDKVSSHEGAEFPQSEDNEIQLDPNSFMQTMQKMFDFDDADSASSSDMDEYGSEDDVDSSLNSKGKKHPNSMPTQNEDGEHLGIQDYMDLMDRELAKTNIGASFEKEQTPPMPKAPPRRKRKKQRNSHISKAASDNPPHANLDDDFGDIDELEDDDFRPVNVDLNMVKNLMDSYGSQQGTAGPTSNILEGMGLRLPQNKDDHELM